MKRIRLAARLARIAVTGLALTVTGVLDGHPGGGPAGAADIVVNIDEASLHRLMREASTIVVGNPSIADVNVQGGTLLLVMGKNPGQTNIIALDRKGEEIDNLAVHVRNGGTRRLTLHLGSSQQSYNCAPVCDRTLSVGDVETMFDVQQKQVQGKTAVSQGTADQAIQAGQ